MLKQAAIILAAIAITACGEDTTSTAAIETAPAVETASVVETAPVVETTEAAVITDATEVEANEAAAETTIEPAPVTDAVVTGDVEG